jgi:hypothetical protein
MTTLTDFFKESQSTLGVFYPKHYIIASFPSFATTQEAAQALRRAGFPDDELLAIPGSEILKYFGEFRSDSGLWAGVMTMLSRAFGTEQAFADADADFAREGAGFLAIHCPDEAQATRIRGFLTPFAPKAMHWYENGGVRCLV